jgi:hypothetical protein
LLSEKRAHYERSLSQDPHRSRYLYYDPDAQDLAFLSDQDNNMASDYRASDRFDFETDQDMFYLDESRRQPARSASFQPKISTSTDHSQQPCFDTLFGRPCLRDQKKPSPCPYNHNKDFLVKYQNEKHLQSNASPFLSPHLHNPRLEKPKPQLRSVEESAVQVDQVPFEPTVIPAVQTSMLKPSLSAKRESLLSHSRFPNRFGEESEDPNDG